MRLLHDESIFTDSSFDFRLLHSGGSLLREKDRCLLLKKFFEGEFICCPLPKIFVVVNEEGRGLTGYFLDSYLVVMVRGRVDHLDRYVVF